MLPVARDLELAHQSLQMSKAAVETHAGGKLRQKPVLTLKEQKEVESLRPQDLREIKRLKKELTRKDNALAEEAALLLVTKRCRPTGETSVRG